MGRVLVSFAGVEAPPNVVAGLRRGDLAGVALFRALNVADLEQVRRLARQLQGSQDGGLPVLIGADQEGGQLIGLGDQTTPFPGNMALGATGSEELARRTGVAIGAECLALGVNVNFAPVCDVNSNPRNPVVGTRSFGEDPLQVAQLSTAFIQGMQRVGVAATAKHFPGHGDTASDSHHGVPVAEHVELSPFQAAIDAGVKLVMVAHVAVPSATGSNELPATLAREIVHAMLREQLTFRGVAISDAMDMGAIAQDDAFAIELIAAANAGTDLLLLGPGVSDHERSVAALAHAVRRRLLDRTQARQSLERITELRRWLARYEQPPLSVVGSAEHRVLAQQIAAESITMVRDDARQIPLRIRAGERIGVITPSLADLTPADTSSYVEHTLVEHIRRRHTATIDIRVQADPCPNEIDEVVASAKELDHLIVATLNAVDQPGQAKLVNALLERHDRVVVVALRTPYDLAAFAAAPTYMCTYSALEPSMQALSAVLFGERRAEGRVPVSIPGLFPVGHRLVSNLK